MLPEASLTFYGPAAAWGAQIKALRPARRAGQIKTPIVLSGCPTHSELGVFWLSGSLRCCLVP